MTIVTIPHSYTSLPRGDYVLVPKPEYEKLMERAHAIPVALMTAKDRRDVARAEREIKTGKYRSWKHVKHELDRLHHVGR